MPSARTLLGLSCATLALCASFAGCSGSGSHARAVLGTSAGGATGTGGHASTGGQHGGDGGPDAALSNCGSILCSGHSHCDTARSHPACACDTGYVRRLSDGGIADDTAQDLPCVVDETCIKLRNLRKTNCRYQINGAPAIGLYFAVDYCAGTAVLPDKLGNLATAFKISEDGREVVGGPEESATIIPHPVESYVTFAIDLSGSMTAASNSAYLSRLISVLDSSMQRLAPGPGDPPVAIALIGFGRTVKELLPFTRDFTTVQAALKSIQTNAAQITSSLGTNGTSINEATGKAIDETERIMALRDAVTDGGVLTSGTVVMITDGIDSTGFKLDTDRIQNTVVNLVSIGISNQISDTELQSIGRDGSFLAQSPDDWASAFDEVTTRVKQYPLRSYLLGYCTTATTGKPSVSVALNGPSGLTNSVDCTFDATALGTGNCDPTYFTNGCQGLECGGMVACGACADGDCCSGGVCHKPNSIDVLGPDTDCRNQDELCRHSNEVCVPKAGTNPQTYVCVAPVAEGQACTDKAKCDQTLDYCTKPPPPSDGGAPSNTTVCEPKPFQLGDRCQDFTSKNYDGAKCSTLNCAQQRADDPTAPFYCLPEARIFDRCAGPTASATCEMGSACQAGADGNSICTDRHWIGCKTDLDCVSGYCQNGVCYSSGACYFSWSEKIDQPPVGF